MSWYYRESTIGKNYEAGHSTVFMTWNLRCWMFGIDFRPDPGWLSIHFLFGPVEIEVCRWRDYAETH
jgi:hypothetical protein